MPEAALGPAPEPGAVPPERSRKVLLLAAFVALLLVAAGGAVVFWPTRNEPGVDTATSKPSRPLTPFEQTLQLLQAQAAALTSGDEKGWLAPLDPANRKMIDRYKIIYRNLRALEISHAEFHAEKQPEASSGDTVVADTALAYCLSGVSCPSWRRSSWVEGPPQAAYRVTVKRVNGAYRITAMTDKGAADDNYLQPAPWDNRALTVLKGKRVIVAGPSSQAKRLKQVLALAEKAAKAVDKYAGYIKNPQRRYRVYVADERGWKDWYGGVDEDWIIGYEIPLNATGGDVILRAKSAGDQRQLAVTVKHELAHVVTLASGHWETGDDQWLVEGIAEYIGALPRKPQETGNHDVLAETFRRRGVPKSIAVPSLTAKADDLTVNTLYAMGHYATACMADKFGERKLMRFTDLVLRQAKKPDEASRSAYGKPFATVDRDCLSWIRKRV
ncbi:hypothetical protein Areg01_51100 [Actinoplanes regularis]|nr:hypothetical protein Areg01_51100 [Actinoplanes regularis]